MKSINGETRIIASRTNYVDNGTEMEVNLDYWMFYSDVIHDEIKKEEKVNECLRDGPRSFRQIFDKLIEG